MKFIYVIKEYIKMAFKSLKYIYSLDKKGTFLRLSVLVMFPILSNIINIINARLTDGMQKSYGTGLMTYILPVFIFLIVFKLLDEFFGFLSGRFNVIWQNKLNQIVYSKQLEDKKDFTIPFIDSSDHEELRQRIEFGAAGNGRYAQVQLTRSVPQFLTIIINLVFAMYIAYTYNWIFASLILLSSLPGFYFLFVRIFAARRNWEGNLELTKYYGNYANMFNNYQGLKDVKSSNNANKFISIYEKGMNGLTNQRIKIHTHYQFLGFLVGLLTTSIILFIQFFVIKDVVTGSILIGQATLIILYISKFESQINTLSQFLPDQYENTVAAKYLFLQSETKQNRDRLSGKGFVTINDYIEFKNIDFKYEDTPFEELHILNKNIDDLATKYFGLQKREIQKKEKENSNFRLQIDNLVINKGEKIAVVGKNGNGKTTFIQLLLNIYQPISGDIILFGNNTKDLSQDTINQQFSPLYQDYSQTPLKTHEYIALSERNNIDMNKVKHSAKLATADEFIEKWDDNYTQQLGVYMKGVKPSKGQWQKLALARAFYKDSPVLILDEPTAAIDSVSSKKIFENLRQIGKDKTIILISHNMIDVVDFEDRILVFEDGKIIGDGHHTELMKKCQPYKNLYESEVK